MTSGGTSATVLFGGAGAASSAPILYLAGFGASGLATGDFDRDGRVDLALGASQIVIAKNQGAICAAP